jgi:phosphotriesterase-related protein
MRISICIFLIVVAACQAPSEKEASPANLIHTVSGPISPEELGRTLIHEHVLVDFIGADSTGYHRWNKDSVVLKMKPYFDSLKDYGVETVIETTPMYLGRDPLLLQKLSKETGLNFLSNTGLYGAVYDQYLPPYAFELTADSLAKMWVSEYENGIENTGIKPGFMKISVDPEAELSEVDEKIVRAAIQAHLATGLTIVSHTGPDGPAFAQLKLLDQAGVSPSAWVWTHAQNGTDSGRLEAARRNAWISLDNVMPDNYERYAEMIVFLDEHRMLNRILISHDAGYYNPDAPNGGPIRGYTAIFKYLLPALKTAGLRTEDIDQLLVKNPRDAYTPRVRKK